MSATAPPAPARASPPAPAATVAAALRRARDRGVDRLDAQLLLARALGRPRSWLLAHDDAAPDADAAARYDADLARRADGVPLAYLLGEKEFHGLDLRVTPDVLVPRPDTETLVEWALQTLAALDAGRRGDLAPAGATAASTKAADRTPASAAAGGEALRIVDLGTGSGAIALAVAQACAASGLVVEVCAVDASAAALEVARDNGRRLGLAVEWLEGDWWSAVEGRRFDLALSNPPYIAAGDPHLAALRHEPLQALASGADGLADLRRIVAGAPRHLRQGGRLLVEHGHDQAAAVRELLHGAGGSGIESRRDLAGIERCSGAAWHGSATTGEPLSG